MTIHYQGHGVTLHHGDCLDVLRTLPDASVDSVVTDPPYGLEFMGKGWDAPWQEADVNADAGFHGGGISQTAGLPSFTGSSNPKCLNCKGTRRGRRDGTAKVAVCLCVDGGRFPNTRAVEMRAFGEWCEAWATECLRVLKPGGHLLAFGGTRTWHRLACAVEDAGFEVRDSIAWLYATGFPKSLNASKALQDSRCQCDVGEYGHGEPATEHLVSGLRGSHVSPPVGTRSGPGPVLLAPVSEPSAPAEGWSELPAAEVRPGQPRMEGGCDLQAAEGQLCRAALRPLPGGVPADGEDGRLHHGAPPRDGSTAGALPAQVGSGEPHQPRPEGQPAGEPGVVPVERGSQARGGWAVCGRCGKPSIPDGLGTALKPAFEPVVVARKPLSGTVAANVLAHGTGALNIDGCRVGMSDADRDRLTEWHAKYGGTKYADGDTYAKGMGDIQPPHAKGRWPANVVLDESQAEALDEQSGTSKDGVAVRRNADGGRKSARVYGDYANPPGEDVGYGGQGGASRFFPTFRYEAKAPTSERPRYKREGGSDNATTYGQMKKRECNVCGNRTCPAGGEQSGKPWPTCGHDDWSWVEQQSARDEFVAHPTVKPLSLMRWLVRLVTPPGGTVLEPFAGSGTTVEACIIEGFDCIAIEKGDEYLPLIMQRIHRRRDPVAAIRQTGDELGLFELDGEGA